MSIVIKEIRKKKYAYVAYRSGNKVIHRYVGAVSDPAVQARIKTLSEEKKIPEKHQNLFWDTDPLKIDIRKNAKYIIERALEFGSLDAIRWLQRLYPTKLIIETCETSRKISPKSVNFWRIWFDYAP